MKEPIKMWKCEGCCEFGPCFCCSPGVHGCDTGEWQVIQMQEVSAEPEKEEMPKAGDWIELKEGDEWGWLKAMFITRNKDIFYFLIEEAIRPATFVVGEGSWSWRRPLKERMKKGQPIVVWDNCGDYKDRVIIQMFSKFGVGDAVYTKISLNRKLTNWDAWRLPTAKELEEIGHHGKGWESEG